MKKKFLLLPFFLLSLLLATGKTCAAESASDEGGRFIPLLDLSKPEDAKGVWVNDFGKRGRYALHYDAGRGCMVMSFTNLYSHFVFPVFTRRLKERAADLDPKTFYVKYRAPEYAASTEFKFQSGKTVHAAIQPIAPGPDLSLSVARVNLAWCNDGSAFAATNVTVAYIAPNGSGTLEIYEIGILDEGRRSSVIPHDPTPVAADAFAVFPEPREWKLTGGVFSLPERCLWNAGALPAVARNEFRKEMADFHGVELVEAAVDESMISFELAGNLGPVVHDGFEITADSRKMTVRALESAGLGFAANTLADLIWRAGGKRIPTFVLRDWPRKRIRPWMDATMSFGHSQKYAVPFYTGMLRRFPLKARYNRIGHYMDIAYQWRSPLMPRYGNAWTAKDYAEIADYVNGHGVRMMPTVQSLGHMDYFIGYPKDNAQRLCEDGNPGVLCTRNPESTALLMDMYDELIALCSRNPGLEPDYFLTCHDEVRWRTHSVPEQMRCTRCAGVPKNRLFLESVVRCRDYLKQRGMKTVIYTDMITDTHNGRNRFNCAAVRDGIPKDVVLASWSTLDDYEINAFARKGYTNWKLYTGFNTNPEGDANTEAIGFGIFTFNWWLSRVRGVKSSTYGILAGYLQAYFAWKQAPSGEEKEGLTLARKYGDFLMHSWSRKPLRRKAGERPLSINPVSRPGKVASLIFTHGADLAPADRVEFLSRKRTNDALKGPVIAVWNVRYSDGATVEIPIHYGWNTGDIDSDGRNQSEVMRRYIVDCRKVIPDADDMRVRFEYEWENPRPDIEIAELSFKETSPLCRYRLFALSAGILKP